MRIVQAIFASVAVSIVYWTGAYAQENPDKVEQLPSAPPQSRAMPENDVSPTIKSIASSHGASVGTGYIGHGGKVSTGVQKGVGYVGPNGLAKIRSQINPAYATRDEQAGFETIEPHKYRPHLSPQQIAHPTSWYEQYQVALSAFDADLVPIARARNKDATKTLDWLVWAQQQRDANNINKTKPLI